MQSTPLSTFTFTASTGRKFTVRRFSTLEVTQTRTEAKKLSTAEGKPYALVLTAVMISRALVEPKLSVADCYKLSTETPGYYGEIAKAVGNFVLGNAQIALAVRTQQLANRVKNQQKGNKGNKGGKR